MSKVTIASLAALTGLSKFAVSRALSGKSGVSEETRHRVQAIAADLGYTPSATKLPLTIAVIFHDTDYINSGFYLKLHRGIEAEALARGYRSTISWTHRPSDIERILRESAGAIMVGPHDPASYAIARELGKAVVRQGRVAPLEEADNVSGTDQEAGAAVAAHFLQLNHRRIVYVHGRPGYRGRVERSHGIREALEEAGNIEFREMIFEPESSFGEHVDALLATGFHPTAFFCARDGIALTVVSELLQRGYRVPQDVSIVGFGNDEVATQISPQLTTVTVDGEQVGAACMRLLDDRLNSRLPRDAWLRVHIANRIIKRGSCGEASETARPGKEPPAERERVADTAIQVRPSTGRPECGTGRNGRVIRRREPAQHS